jgi:hypothetical protein
MKTTILLGLLIAVNTSLLAADAKEELTAAAKKLGQKDNYSWKTTLDFGNFTTTTEGKANKDEWAFLGMSGRDNTTREVFLKKGKAVVKLPDEGWQTLSELENATDGARGRQFLVRRLRNFKTPVEEAINLVAKTKELSKADDVYSGELTEAGAKELLTFGRGRGQDAPEAKNAKGSVKFWVKDGVLSKYEFKQSGTITVGDNEREIDGTTTTEIKEVDTTKIEVPEAAKKKLES